MKHHRESNPSRSDECLVLLLLKFTFLLSVHGNLLVILLKSSKILTSLRELSLLHTLSNIPMHEGTLCVHEIELVVDAAEGLSDGGVVGNHATRTLSLSDVSIRNLERRFGVDSGLESSRTPVNKLDRALVLDSSHGSLHIRRCDISTVHEATRHELSVGRITLGKKSAGVGHDRSSQLSNRESLMVCLLAGHKRRIRRDEQMKTRVRNEHGGEVVNINIQGSIEAKRCCQRRNNLSDEPVKIRVGRTLNIKSCLTNSVESLIIKVESKIRVLKK